MCAVGWRTGEGVIWPGFSRCEGEVHRQSELPQQGRPWARASAYHMGETCGQPASDISEDWKAQETRQAADKSDAVGITVPNQDQSRRLSDHVTVRTNSGVASCGNARCRDCGTPGVRSRPLPHSARRRVASICLFESLRPSATTTSRLRQYTLTRALLELTFDRVCHGSTYKTASTLSLARRLRDGDTNDCRIDNLQQQQNFH